MKLEIQFNNSSDISNSFGFTLFDMTKFNLEMIFKCNYSLKKLSATQTFTLTMCSLPRVNRFLIGLDYHQFQVSHLKTDFFSIFGDILNQDFMETSTAHWVRQNLIFMANSQHFKSSLYAIIRPRLIFNFLNSKMIFENHLIFKNHHPQDSLYRAPCASEGSIVIAHVEVIYRLSFSQGAGSSIWIQVVHPKKKQDIMYSKKSFLISKGLVTPFDRGKISSCMLEDKKNLKLEESSINFHLNDVYLMMIIKKQSLLRLTYPLLFRSINYGTFILGGMEKAFNIYRSRTYISEQMFTISQSILNFLVENFFPTKFSIKS